MERSATIDVFRGMKKGKCYTIALSEEAVWRSLSGHWAYHAQERATWSIETTTETVPVVGGDYEDWGVPGEPRPHVSWNCPACGGIHDTDVAKDEVSPALWWCERRAFDSMFLVHWKDEKE